jgi:SAM-dependent methyltransferase
MNRTSILELLDTDSGTPAEIAASIADLRSFNWWLGGISTSQALIERVSRERGKSWLSVLEVAAGSGYVPKTVGRRLKDQGVSLEITLLDRAVSHLGNDTQVVVGDALALPFLESSFDLVSCTLFAHHLSPPQLVRFFNEGLRVCRFAVVINDLVRSPIHLAFAYAGYPLYRSRITRHDAPASVRQAYTVNEMDSLLKQTKAARVDIERRYFYRMGVIAWKN